MKIAYITAGAAGRYCGNCLRDNALALALRDLGENVLLIPTYTPIRTDIADASEKRLFFNGVRVYLEQKYRFFRRRRRVLDRFLASRTLIRVLSRLATKTDPRDLGDLTVSMLRGEDGHQRKELDELAGWLEREVRPDVVHLTNVLLVGMARTLRQALGVPVFCGLQAEDSFLDFLAEPQRDEALSLIRERGSEVDGLVAVSRYYADYAAASFGLPGGKISVVLPGIPLEGHDPITYRQGPGLTVGFLARIAPEKGLHLLCEAFTLLANSREFPGLRLRVAGFLAPDQVAYVRRLRREFEHAGLGDRVEIIGTVDRAAKLAFLRSIDVLSVPSIYPDPKGLYVLEALASSVPVVEPRHGIFPELIEKTGGGELFEPEDVGSLFETLRRVLLDVDLRRRLGEAGRTAVHAGFSAERMARDTLEVYRSVRSVTG